jgi:hypothetical protein
MPTRTKIDTTTPAPGSNNLGSRDALVHAVPVLELEVGGQQKALLAVFEVGGEVLLAPQRAAGFHEPGLQVEDRAPGLERGVVGEPRLNLGADRDAGAPGRHFGVVGDGGRRCFNELAALQAEQIGGFERQEGVRCPRVDDAVEQDGGMPLGLDDELQNRDVARPVFEALVGHETAKSAGGDVGRWDAEERDAGVQEPELVKQLSFGVTYGDQLAPANSDALPTMVVDLRRERQGMIFAVLGIDLGNGAGGHGEEVDHAPSVAAGISAFQDGARQTASQAVGPIDECANDHDCNDNEHTFAFNPRRKIGTKRRKIGARSLGPPPAPTAEAGARVQQGPPTTVGVFTTSKNPGSNHATAGKLVTNYLTTPSCVAKSLTGGHHNKSPQSPLDLLPLGERRSRDRLCTEEDHEVVVLTSFVSADRSQSEEGRKAEDEDPADLHPD